MKLKQTVFLPSLAHGLLIPFSKTNALVRRDATSGNLTGDGLGYSISFSLGGQDFVSVLDTGSSDVWVPQKDGCEASSSASTGDDATCQYTFDPSSSKSFSANESTTFNITYGDGSSAVGYYAQDTLVLGSATVTGANFALATQASTNSVFGVGLIDGENSWYDNYAMDSSNEITNDGGVKYPNFSYQLYSEGITTSAAYSLWLGNPFDYSGSILFGGVDSNKYTGGLYTVPIDYEPAAYYNDGTSVNFPDLTRFLVMVDSMSVTLGSQTEKIMQGPYPALLDSGSTISTFSSGVGGVLNAMFGVSDSNNVIGCGLPEGNITITIRGQDFYIPFDIFVPTVHNSDGDELVTSSGDIACSPGVQIDDDSTFFIFGDNILSALYLVYDLENSEISIAQSNLDASNDDESGVESISSSVPSATQASGYSSQVSTYVLEHVHSIDFTITADIVTSISGDDVATRSTVGGSVSGDGATTTGILQTITASGAAELSGTAEPSASRSSGSSSHSSSGSSSSSSSASSNGASSNALFVPAGAFAAFLTFVLL